MSKTIVLKDKIGRILYGRVTKETEKIVTISHVIVCLKCTAVSGGLAPLMKNGPSAHSQMKVEPDSFTETFQVETIKQRSDLDPVTHQKAIAAWEYFRTKRDGKKTAAKPEPPKVKEPTPEPVTPVIPPDVVPVDDDDDFEEPKPLDFVESAETEGDSEDKPKEKRRRGFDFSGE